MNDKILVVDDDKNICEILAMYFRAQQYEVSCANDGVEALYKFEIFNPDIVLLDIMMPNIDGWTVCKKIRAMSNCPIIMITAKEEVFDKVLGLEIGADDYIVKPFDMKEVVARVKAVLRRGNRKDEGEFKGKIEYDNLIIDFDRYTITVNGEEIEAPLKEVELLGYLTKNPNKTLTRQELLDHVWGYNYQGDTRTLDVHITRIRNKISNASNHWEIKTIFKVGYRFEVYD